MRTKCLTLGLSVAASAMAMAADLVVGVGESQTISGVQSFDRIFCNGSLTIEEGAEISCTSFCMASGVVENVSVTLQNGSTLSMPSETGGGCLIGCDGGAGVLTLGTNAIFKTSKNVSVQYTTPQGDAFFTNENPFPTSAKIFIHLMDNACMDGQKEESTFKCGAGKILTYGNYGRFEGITILLDKDASLCYCSVQQDSRPDCRILFNGGYIRQKYWNSANSATVASNIGWWEYKVSGARMYLTGTNQNDIVIQRDSYANSVFHLSSGGSRFTLDGDGGLVLRGSHRLHSSGIVTRLVDEPHSPTKDWITMKFPGRIAFEDNTYVMLAAWGKALEPGVPRSDFFPDGAVLEIGPKATLALYGADITNATIVANGSIINGSTATSTIVLYGDADSRIESLGTNIVVSKSGAGCLTFGTNIVDVLAVNVNAGSLAIDGKDDAGTAAGIRELTLGAETVFKTTSSAAKRNVAVRNLAMDATASAEVGYFAPEADGSLSLLNYGFPISKTPAHLPFKVTKTINRKNLRSWSLYVDGVLQGTVGNAAPSISTHGGWLTLGDFGTKVVFR